MGPAYGGPSKVLEELSAALSQQSLSIDVATTNINGRELLALPLGVPIEQRGVRTFYFPAQARNSFVPSWSLTRWLWRHARDYTLIHLHSIFSYPTLAASRIAARVRTPYIVAPHGMVEPWCLGYKGWKKQPYLRLFELRTLAGAAALHALVRQEEANLRALDMSNPIFVLPNGINLAEYAHPPAKEFFTSRYEETRGKKIVLFLGRIDPKKGLDLLVKSFAQLRRESDASEKLHLVIAGPDLVNYAAEVKEAIAGERMAEHVLMPGMLTGEMKLAALAAADVFVLPSRSEGFSMAVLEAMALARPVIITEGCNFPEVRQARAGFVIAPQTEALTRAMREILFASEDVRAEMGARGQRLVRGEYNWDAIAAKLRRVYEDIITGKSQAKDWHNS